MKMPLTKHWCLDNNCGFKETSHKVRDGWKCPKCKGPMMSRIVAKDKQCDQVFVEFDNGSESKMVKVKPILEQDLHKVSDEHAK
ncbi:hypothetical protein BK704_11125 [[Bacillus thuringiensis] serovar konkukian]|nr:hypothetical protein [Bacillus thuringiensis]MED1305718.1 hypothetical protein [Bacillus pacificus]OUB11996.1 hypothetical protein BK704_11220 [[Bacillus thuringiensis] serovar konkukian]OUB12002.1 hypothetical protein BK704_11195 [[Bacillus thuringiensis] serovar konkukian]OUB12012.1 hypothetical protein BK704_11160 [[Bacillus thuringiensis] serovar konkukian]OUB12023.1 hypothetical protein BK704_11125 [[Bacillus thuringiensis] serovar konkukian]